jgi:DNA polymerase-3 subunit epsilon
MKNNITPLVFLDTETTGFSPTKHEMIEFAALKVHPDGLVEPLDIKITPKRIEDASEEALAVNGYSEELWEDSIDLEEAMPQIVAFLSGSILVGHNIKFDLSFVKAAARSVKAGPIPTRNEDTLFLAKEYLRRKGLRKFDLTSVCTFLGISNYGAHTAMSDVVRCKEVFDKIAHLRK